MKILLFGNGVALRFKYEEYNYESLITKFLEGLETSVAIGKQGNAFLTTNKLIEEIKKLALDKDNLNESFIFSVFKMVFITMIDSHSLSTPSITQMGFLSAENFWEVIYNKLCNSNETTTFGLNQSFGSYFTWSYAAISYALARAISINKENDSYISINYSDTFINYLKSYNKIITTNYYTGIANVTYLHGELKIRNEKEFKFLQPGLERKHTLGQEFNESIGVAFKMLVGNTYNDKVFMNSVINWNDPLTKKPPQDSILISPDDEFDIVGMSTQGDTDLFMKIFMRAKKINIYVHTQDDFNAWQELTSNFDSDKIVIKFNDEFEGFK